MKLVVVSYKECWHSSASPSGYATVGGFPFQMQAISELFDQTKVVVPIRPGPILPGARPLVGHNLSVIPLPEPPGANLRRKISLLTWLPRNLPRIVRVIQQTDSVHIPAPGDISIIGMLVALLAHKPLFVRYCGIWGKPNTISERFVFWLLERIADDRNIVMATGGAETLPSKNNPAIRWIFSSALSEGEITAIEPAQTWRVGMPLKLITVGRLSTGKNISALIQAIPQVVESYPQVQLEILGDGVERESLEKLVMKLGMTTRIKFLGNVPHEKVIERLTVSHLFVFPTLGEGFPKAVLEAMACGLPVIATKLSVLPQLIGDKNGILLRSPSPDALANAIIKMISNDDRFAEMAASARQTSMAYTLERWRDDISERLSTHWGPLRNK